MSECLICGPMFIGKCPHRMTPSDAKGKPVREWTLQYQQNAFRITSQPTSGFEKGELIDVIEKSAYQEELKLRLDLEDHLAKVQTSSCDEIAKLTYELNTAVAALEKIENVTGAMPNYAICNIVSDYAKDALAKIAGRGK